MFRNPRENVNRPSTDRLTHSTGRPPSPPNNNNNSPHPRQSPRPPATVTVIKQPTMATTKAKATPTKTPVTPKLGGVQKTKGKANGNILTFFKRAEQLADNLFVPERFNEDGGAVKRRRVDDDAVKEVEALDSGRGCSPPPLLMVQDEAVVDMKEEEEEMPALQTSSGNKRAGPFVEDSDSDEDETAIASRPRRTFQRCKIPTAEVKAEEQASDVPLQEVPIPPSLKHEATSYGELGDFEGFENVEDFEDEEFEGDGEEFQERRWMAEQAEMGENELEGIEGDTGDVDLEDGEETEIKNEDTDTTNAPTCPICSIALLRVTDEQASVHVNNCLDGNPTPLPVQEPAVETTTTKPPSTRFIRPPKPGQQNPFTIASNKKEPQTAFSTLMSNHAEDRAWKTAAAAEAKARGKPAFERTCPFYKILPGFSICVDAFRYGAVEGCQAYFLSHFHSDHYIGLTSSWRHGPIYCSRVTGNLVRQQLKVDPKWVVDLEFEQEVEVPNTNGVRVTMISANHCPGSSLYLFEKVVGKGQNPKVQRVLHCGDFRACRAHLEHPLLRPDVADIVTGKTREQKLDVCYLDTTYLNPKYAFPPQEDVIKACADMCVSLNNAKPDDQDGWETMKRERAGSGMVQFLQTGTASIKQEDIEPTDGALSTSPRGKLLVVVGTYSIGKERVCLGIAKALNSKIYAPPGKQRICACLEDPELNARLTTDPREAQVHMTPLFEIRAETLDDYLKDYHGTFTRAVGFRPSGWNYRPPNSRFVESPAVQTVLHGSNWKSSYSMKDLAPQRGSTKRAACFGVPYSEHSSFRELSMFCCALRIERVIPTVNVGSVKGREKMRVWCERWAQERKKNGLFKAEMF
ncbi:DRMBL-domain-containing protein [Tothia fuscella]|uniref:DRMBL-domain-containing protein n=1 Tax=Tothia fuscella TaxID=1048955 RepID=A0A9P4U355_9PEZI|nr:DRMBL-domain-containing protein [Tothia fuscella]